VGEGRGEDVVEAGALAAGELGLARAPVDLVVVQRRGRR